MFNPSVTFTTELLESMIQKDVVHFVRSTYKRGKMPDEENFKDSFLISHYHNSAEAEMHFNAVPHDRNRFLYDAAKPEHLEKLRMAASQPGGYRIFSKIIIPEIENTVTKIYRENTKRYLYKNTHWDLKGRVRITPFLYFQLGELYARITHQGDKIIVKFEDLENF
ncbi:MAG: hypothetical protein ABIS01_16340 [Ferruginibacter sp.]